MHGVRMTPKTLVLIGTLMQFIGAFGIGWSLLEYRWTGEFNTHCVPLDDRRICRLRPGLYPNLMGVYCG